MERQRAGEEDSDGAAPCCPSGATDQGSPRKYVMRPQQISAPNVREVRSHAYGVGGAKPEVRRCMETRTRHRQGRWLQAAASADELGPNGQSTCAPLLARDCRPSTAKRITAPQSLPARADAGIRADFLQLLTTSDGEADNFASATIGRLREGLLGSRRGGSLRPPRTSAVSKPSRHNGRA